MPIRDEIFQDILKQKSTAQDIIRNKYLKRLHQLTKRDTIIYACNLSPRKQGNIPSNVLSINQEDIQGFMSALHGLKGDKLDLIIHSPGGSLEAADQIVQYLREKYSHIRAVVPLTAMSAATMIACACDEIVMGKQSALGPIDPQLTLMSPTGPFSTPAQSILDEFERMKSEVISDPRTAPLWVSKLHSYPHGLLKNCETTIALSKLRVGEWLDKYMFAADTEKKGTAIANWLGEATIHKTHGRPIGLEIARSQGLKIVKLEDDQELQDRVLSVFHATMAAFEFSPCIKLIQNHNGKGTMINAMLNPPPMMAPGP